MPKIAAWIVAVALALAAIASLWLAGEMRYRNCIMAVDLRYPVAYQQPTDKTETQFGIGPQPHFVFHDRAERSEAISACSRWP